MHRVLCSSAAEEIREPREREQRGRLAVTRRWLQNCVRRCRRRAAREMQRFAHVAPAHGQLRLTDVKLAFGCTSRHDCGEFQERRRVVGEAQLSGAAAANAALGDVMRENCVASLVVGNWDYRCRGCGGCCCRRAERYGARQHRNLGAAPPRDAFATSRPTTSSPTPTAMPSTKIASLTPAERRTDRIYRAAKADAFAKVPADVAAAAAKAPAPPQRRLQPRRRRLLRPRSAKRTPTPPSPSS